MKKQYLVLLLLASPLLVPAQEFQNPNSSYFPIGVWLQTPSNAAAYKNAGINIYVGLWNALDQPQLTTLKNAGMRVICEQNAFGLTKLSDTLIYGWAQDDEPDNAQWNATTQQYDPCINPSVIINKYNTIKSNDPSRPVYLNLGQGVSYTDWIGRGTCTGKTDMYPDYKNGYLKGCDIGSYDIYPVNNSDSKITGKLWYVPKGVDSLKLWTANNKPVWCWIECTKIDANSPSKPTTADVKSEVWMALIHGVKGFGYFCHSWTPTFVEAALLADASMLSAVTAINAQVTALAPVLNSANTTGYASVSSANSSVPIDIMTKNYGGADYIFSVAMRPGTTAATFTVASGVNVEVLGENRTLTVSGGKFTDNFSSYGVHLYKITSAAGIAEEEGDNTVFVYPNPFRDELTIERNELVVFPCNITFYDLSGSMVYSNPNFTGRKLIFKRGSLSSGIYFYSIRNSRTGFVNRGKICVN